MGEWRELDALSDEDAFFPEEKGKDDDGWPMPTYDDLSGDEDCDHEVTRRAISEKLSELSPELADKVDECEKISLEKEGKFLRKKIDPRLPSDREVEEHMMQGHIPYRNWCTICVRSMGKDDSHVSCPTEERKVPEYHFD